MNTEELRLVLETISNIAGDAGTAAIVWMALHYGTKLLGMAVVVVPIVLAVVFCARAISASMQWSAMGREVSKAWGGCASKYGDPDATDTAALHRAIAAAKDRKE